MSRTLPSGIVVEKLPDGVRWTFPFQTGRQRWKGIPDLIVGLFFVLFSLSGAFLIVYSVHTGMLPREQPWWRVHAILVGLALLFSLIGFKMIELGILSLAGHPEIEILGGKLKSITRAGWIRASESRPVDRLRRIHLDEEKSSKSTEPNQVAILCMDFEGLKPLRLTQGFRLENLRMLADEIVRHVGFSSPQNLPESGPVPIQVVVNSAADGRILRPVHSAVIEDRRDSELTLTVPPPGLAGGANWGIVLVGSIFLLVGLGMTAFAIAAFVRGSSSDLWFGLLFAGAGAYALCLGLQFSRVLTILQTSEGRISVTESGPFGTSRREWPLADIDHFQCGLSNISVNEQSLPLPQLQILCLKTSVSPNRPTNLQSIITFIDDEMLRRRGIAHGCLTGRGVDELDWIAAELNAALGLVRPEDKS